MTENITNLKATGQKIYLGDPVVCSATEAERASEHHGFNRNSVIGSRNKHGRLGIAVTPEGDDRNLQVAFDISDVTVVPGIDGVGQ